MAKTNKERLQDEIHRKLGNYSVGKFDPMMEQLNDLNIKKVMKALTFGEETFTNYVEVPITIDRAKHVVSILLDVINGIDFGVETASDYKARKGTQNEYSKLVRRVHRRGDQSGNGAF